MPGAYAISAEGDAMRCSDLPLQRPRWTLVGQHTEICLVQLRRQRSHIIAGATGSTFEPAASPQDLEISLGPRRELNYVLLQRLASGQAVTLHRKGISARREIFIEAIPGILRPIWLPLA
jgi:hypothetical protein